MVDAEGDRLPEFHAIYRETAARAGFLIRTEQAYRDVWDAYRPGGRARLLFAEDASGVAQATLFLVRSGPRVVEPYGGMTAVGAEGRANYLLKWEAIRTSKERGATSYDLWGLARRDRAFQDRVRRPRGPVHRGLGPGAQRVGRRTFEIAQRGRVWVERRRHGLSAIGPVAASWAPPGSTLDLSRGDAEDLERWDARMVDGPGGHVYQSRAWGDYQATAGWRTRSCVFRTGSACSRSSAAIRCSRAARRT